MKKLNLVLGPNKLAAMLKEAEDAGKKTHRILVTVELNEKTLEFSTVRFGPIDQDLNPITNKGGAEISADGCPYPPDCNTAFTQLLNKQISGEQFSRCADEIKRNSQP